MDFTRTNWGLKPTGFDWRAAVLSIINVIISIVIYYPFFKVWDKKQLEKEAKDSASKSTNTEASKGNNVEAINLTDNNLSVESSSLKTTISTKIIALFDTLNKFKRLAKENA